MIDEDELLSRKDRILLFVEENRAAILVGVVLFLVAAIALGGVVWVERHNSSQALALEGKAQLLYYDRPPDKPELTRENLDKAVELYREILDKYPRTASARRSLFFLGNTLMELNDLQGATEAYQNLIGQYPDEEMFLGIVYQRLGYAHLLNGNQDRAFEAFSKVLDLPNALNKDQVLFEFAKLEEAAQNPQKALTHYKQLMAQYPTSPFSNEASLRVKILEPKEESQAPEKVDDKGMKSEKPEEAQKAVSNEATPNEKGSQGEKERPE